MVQNNSFAMVIKKFCKTTSIAFIRHIFDPHFGILYIITFLGVASYCVFQCVCNVQSYLSYNVMTKTVFVNQSSLHFPAISFCPVHSEKKSLGGNFPDYQVGLAFMYANTMGETSKLMEENKLTCNNHNNLSDEAKLKISVENGKLLDNGSLWSIPNPYVNFEETMTKCFWLDEKISCNNVFMNHITDVTQCFTFNPGKDLAAFTLQTQTGYGINLSIYDEKLYKVDGPNRGLQLVMNSNQSEYCGHDLKKRGAGFFMQIHDVDTNPSFLLNPSTHIAPGFDINVVINPTVYIKKTEHLGRCSQFVPLYTTPHAQIYVEEHCYMQCAAEHILKACHCIATNLGGFVSRYRERLYGPANADDFHLCMGNQYICMKHWIYDTLKSKSMTNLCPYCKPPCKKTKYTSQITSLRLSQKKFKLGQENFKNMTYHEFLKNYIFIRFSFDDMKILLVEEFQAFTLQQMFIFIGSNICLYHGMSFVSSFELVQLLFELIKVLVKKLCRCDSKQSKEKNKNKMPNKRTRRTKRKVKPNLTTTTQMFELVDKKTFKNKNQQRKISVTDLL